MRQSATTGWPGDEAVIRQALLDYGASFTAFDVARIANHFHDPCTLVGGLCQTDPANPALPEPASPMLHSRSSSHRKPGQSAVGGAP